MDRKKIARRLARVAIMLASGAHLKVADVNDPKKLEEWIRLQNIFPNTQQGNQLLIDIMGQYLGDIKKMVNNIRLYEKVENKMKSLFIAIKSSTNPPNDIKGKDAQDFYNFLYVKKPTAKLIFDWVCNRMINNSKKLLTTNPTRPTAQKPGENWDKVKEILELFDGRSLLFEQYINSELDRYTDLITPKGQDSRTPSFGPAGQALGPVPMSYTTKPRDHKKTEVFNIHEFYLNFKDYIQRLNAMQVQPGGSTTDSANPYQTPIVKAGQLLDQIDQTTLMLSSTGVEYSSTFSPKNLIFKILSNTTVSFNSGTGGNGLSVSFNSSRNDTPMDVLYSLFVARMMPDIKKEQQFYEVQNQQCKAMLSSLNLTMHIAISQVSGKKQDAFDSFVGLAKTSSQQWLRIIRQVKTLDKKFFLMIIGAIQEINGIAVAYDSALQQQLTQAVALTKQCKAYCAAARKKLGIKAAPPSGTGNGKKKQSSVIVAGEFDSLTIEEIFDGLEQSLSALCSWCTSVSKIILQCKNELTDKINELVKQINEYADAKKEQFDEATSLMNADVENLKKIVDECENIIDESIDESSNEQQEDIRPFNKVDFGVVDNTLDYDVAASEDDDDDL